MFSIFKKREPQAAPTQKQIDDVLQEMGVSILLITHLGQIVMASDSLRSRPRDFLDGRVMEVMISSPNCAPYFIYYDNQEYYFKMIEPLQSPSGLQECTTYRSNVSQALGMYLVFYLMKTQGKDILHPQMSFSHNRIHTNVIAYVEKLSNWYPIQHRSKESDFATENKIAQVNRGAIDITDVIAVHELSPA